MAKTMMFDASGAESCAVAVADNLLRRLIDCWLKLSSEDRRVINSIVEQHTRTCRDLTADIGVEIDRRFGNIMPERHFIERSDDRMFLDEIALEEITE